MNNSVFFSACIIQLLSVCATANTSLWLNRFFSMNFYLGILFVCFFFFGRTLVFFFISIFFCSWWCFLLLRQFHFSEDFHKKMMLQRSQIVYTSFIYDRCFHIRTAHALKSTFQRDFVSNPWTSLLLLLLLVSLS